MSNFTSVRHSVHALLLAAGMAVANPVPAFAKEAHQFEIVAGDNAQVIQEFAAQSGVQILASVDELEGKKLRSVSGTLSTDEGLKALLAGTGLTHQYVGERTVALMSTAANTTDASPKNSSDRFRLASAGSSDVPAEAGPEAKAQSAAQQGGKDAADKPSAETDKAYDSPFAVQEVTVNGMRYGADRTTSGRLSQKYIDTPQAVSVITSELLKDANLFDSVSALKYVPSVKADQSWSPVTYIRGLLTGEFYIDGFLLGGLWAGAYDTGFFDRIEVVKGPSAIAFGRGNPAGFLNYVTKSPLFTQSTEINTMLGTGGPAANRRIFVDNNGLITDDGETAYRFMLTHSDGSSTQDGSEFERNAAMLAVTRKLGDRGDLKLNGAWGSVHNPADLTYVSWTDPTFRSVYMTNANNATQDVPLFDADHVFRMDDDRLLTDNWGLSATLNYQLFRHFTVRQAFKTQGFESSRRIAIVDVTGVRRDPADGVLKISSPMQDALITQDKLLYQSDFVWQQQSGFLDSTYTVLAGGDYSEMNQALAIRSTTINQLLLDYNPHASYAWTGDLDKLGSTLFSKDWSYYGQVSASFLGEKIQPSASVRKLYYDQTTRNRVTGAVSYNKNSSPLLGTYSLLVKPLTWLSFYGTKSKYQVAPTVQFEYQNFATDDPRSSRLLTSQASTDLTEFGFKGSVLDDKVIFTVARFKVKNYGSPRLLILTENVPTDLPGPFYQYFLSNDSVEGWEFEVFGQPTERLTFMAGANLYTDSNQNVPAGNAIYNTEIGGLVDTVYGNVKYSFGPSDLEGFAVRGGFKSYLSGYNVNAAPTVRLTGNVPYPDTKTAVDLGVSYGFSEGRYRVDLSSTNAFHESAIPTGAVGGFLSGRLVYLNFDARF